MRRWIALGIAGLAIAWGPYLYAELSRRPVESARLKSSARASLFEDAAPPPAATATPSDHSESQLAAATDPAPRPRPIPTPSPPRVAEPAAPSPSESDTTAQGDEHFDPSGLPGELAPAFRSAFDTQPRDAFWAVEEEPRLAGLIHGVGVPDGAISEVACRKTVCRVAFNGTDIDKDVELKLYARMREEFGHTLALEVRGTESEAQASLYVLRPGYKLEPGRR